MNSDQDKIEILKKRLDSISNAPGHSLRPKLHKHASLVSNTWQDDGEDEGGDNDVIVTNIPELKKKNAQNMGGGSGISSGNPLDSMGLMHGGTAFVDTSTSFDNPEYTAVDYDAAKPNSGSGNMSGGMPGSMSGGNNGYTPNGDRVVSRGGNDWLATQGGRDNKGRKGGRDGRGNFLKKALLISFFALLAAGAFVWYSYSSGNNYISASNIDIAVVGPVSTPSGEALTLDIDVHNRNASQLETVDLVVQYPDGTRKAEDGVTTVLNDRIPIGTIKQGETVRRRVEVLLFGEENMKKEFKFTVQYRVPGSVILFNKEKTYPIFIGSAPISINVSSLKEVAPNQTTTFKATITSNSPNVIRNLVFNATYPSGFVFESSNPPTSFGNNVWTIGDMKPGDTREISISGKVIGDASVERYFTFTAGTEDPIDRSRIATRLVESKEKIEIRKPFFSADVSLDKSGDAVYVGRAGDPIQAEIVWQNNLDVPLTDAIIEAKLTGATLDKASVSGGRGFYDSVTNTITWDRSSVEELSELSPGKSGLLQFSFASAPANQQNNSNLRRQEIGLAITVRAKRLSENQVPEELKSTASRTVKIASAFAFSSKVTHSIGPIENSGPIPPKAEAKTTYTIMNSVRNSFNNVKNVTYTATLPSYVRWTNKVYPESAAANIKYNADTRQITWTLGDIAPGVGYNSSARDFAFQVELLPSVSQVGNAPILVNPQRLAGTDAFTESVIETTLPAIDTSMESDPQFQFGFEKVVR